MLMLILLVSLKTAPPTQTKTTPTRFIFSTERRLQDNLEEVAGEKEV